MPENKKAVHDDFVSKVVKDPKQPPDAQLLTGFVGKSSEEGFTRFYTDANLRDFIDIPDDAILHTEKVSLEHSPLGGSHVWIDRNAEVIHGTVGPQRTKAKFFQGPIAAQAGAGAGFPPLPPSPAFPQRPPSSAPLFCPSPIPQCPHPTVLCPVTHLPPCPITHPPQCLPPTHILPCPPSSVPIACYSPLPVCPITHAAPCPITQPPQCLPPTHFPPCPPSAVVVCPTHAIVCPPSHLPIQCPTPIHGCPTPPVICPAPSVLHVCPTQLCPSVHIPCPTGFGCPIPTAGCPFNPGGGNPVAGGGGVVG